MDDASVEPTVMSLDLLREITNDFSEERKIGSGTFGKVYLARFHYGPIMETYINKFCIRFNHIGPMGPAPQRYVRVFPAAEEERYSSDLGVHQDGEKIAVKMLYDMPGHDDEQFQNEFKNLTRLRHQNIVRLIGYCRDIQEVQVKYKGKLVLAEKAHRALCLDYMPNGSLDKYLSDECDRYNWHTCYRIIKGICQGLKYLHDELKPPIYHLDLKPANVLLDENMVPRIADFGISRLFSGEQTRCTQSLLGTLGYSPPEFIRSNLISNKFDIFSLGVVIIKMMAGRAGYYKSTEMSSQEFTNLVQENWKNRPLETSNQKNAYSEQVKICIEIGLSCVQEDRHKRPTIQNIVDMLNGTEPKFTYAESLGDITQSGKISNPNHQQATPSRSNPSSSYNLEVDKNTLPQYAQDPNDQHADKIYDGSTFNQDILSTSHSNLFEENTEAVLDGNSWNDYEEYSDDGDSLPSIEGFQIVGDPKPGYTLTACGFPKNGTTLCNFQWVRWVAWLQDGTRETIEGATMYDYFVTADDVGALLAVDCTPMDDNGLQGSLVRMFANGEYKITCDQDMQNDIDICISRGRSDFDVYVLAHSMDEWQQGTLLLRRTGYQLNLSHNDEVVIDEKYSPSLQMKIPNGPTTQFVLVSSGGLNLPVNTQGITEPSSEDNDIRLRDLIVLVMRAFQNKALLYAKRKGKARHICVKPEIPL